MPFLGCMQSARSRWIVPEIDSMEIVKNKVMESPGNHQWTFCTNSAFCNSDQNNIHNHNMQLKLIRFGRRLNMFQTSLISSTSTSSLAMSTAQTWLTMHLRFGATTNNGLPCPILIGRMRERRLLQDPSSSPLISRTYYYCYPLNFQ